ncbi:MAG TPA: ATP-binding protein [Ruminiclostridium sp.]|nr:ATP-binding protein [Ruminiclostridium sp.]
MFKKLRLKLTLTNVIVVAVILLIFAVVVFVFMFKATNDQTNQLINLVSSNEGLSNAQAIPRKKGHEGHELIYFYVKLDRQNSITYISSGYDLRNEHIVNLVNKVLNRHNPTGNIDLSDDESYHFFRGGLADGSGSYIIFINTHPDHEMLWDLLFILLFAGFFGLILAFFGSLFMAEKSIIPIKKSWQRQRDFVADASHELRTPLTVIETTTDLLMNRGTRTIESQIKWLENIQAENKVMTKLVNDMLFLARADSEQNLFEKKHFPLHIALLEAYIPFEALAIQKGVILKPFEGQSVDIYGDESRIKQLAAILIDNALKHTPSGGNIRMTLADRGRTAEIVVSDSGEGICEEHIHRIFERFYRADKSRSRSEGSAGLGLAIADYIVSGHKGQIKVESKLGSGTTFHIVLPK